MTQNPVLLARIGLSGLALAVLAGCASTVAPDPDAQAPHCVRDNRGRVRVCTSQTVPSLRADQQAKRFVADPSALTVYVLRSSWGDTRELLALALDGRAADIETTPNSLVRLRLAPGEHSLAFEQGGRQSVTSVSGLAGEQRFVWIELDAWRVGRQLRWGVEPEASLRARAQQARLVADRTLR